MKKIKAWAKARARKGSIAHITMAIGLGVLSGTGIGASAWLSTTGGTIQAEDRYDNSNANVSQLSLDHAVSATVQVHTGHGMGSGTVIHQDENGKLYILTCAHVIDNGHGVWIDHLGDDIKCHILFSDFATDLALVKTELGIANYAGTVVNEFAEFKDVKAGDATYSIGYPLGIGPVLTQGIVAKENHYLPTPWAGNSILGSANISPGSSGGGMYVLEDGDLKFLGLNQWGMGGLDGVYGFVPVSEVKMMFEREGYTWLLNQ